MRSSVTWQRICGAVGFHFQGQGMMQNDGCTFCRDVAAHVTSRIAVCTPRYFYFYPLPKAGDGRRTGAPSAVKVVAHVVSSGLLHVPRGWLFWWFNTCRSRVGGVFWTSRLGEHKAHQRHSCNGKMLRCRAVCSVSTLEKRNDRKALTCGSECFSIWPLGHCSRARLVADGQQLCAPVVHSA